MALNTRSVLKIIGVFDDKISGKFKKLAKDSKKVREQIKGINKALGPLNNKITQAAGVFIGASAIKKAISLARIQEEVQLKLKATLGENIELYKDLADFASKRQSQTFFTDEDTIDAMAKFAALDVPLDKIKEFVTASQNIAATGLLSYEAAVAQLATTISGEVTFLGRRFKVIKELSKEELQRGGAAAKINEQLGPIAEDITKTKFGLFQQEINIINDEFERLGRTMIKIVVPAIVRARKAFQGLVTLVTSTVEPLIPLINALLKPIELVIKALVATGTTIGVLGIAKKVFGPSGFLRAGFKILLSVVTAILSPMGLLVAIIVGAVALLVRATLKVEPLRKAFGGLLILGSAVFSIIGRLLKELLGLIGSISVIVSNFIDTFVKGQIEAETWLGRLITGLGELFDAVESGELTIEDVTDAIFADVTSTIVNIWIFINRQWSRFKILLIQIGGLSGKIMNGIIVTVMKGLSLIISDATRKIKGLLELIEPVAEFLSINVRGVIDNISVSDDAVKSQIKKLEDIQHDRDASDAKRILAIIASEKEFAESMLEAAEDLRIETMDAIADRMASREVFKGLSDEARLSILREARALGEKEGTLVRRILSEAISGDTDAASSVQEFMDGIKKILEKEGVEVDIEISGSSRRKLDESLADILKIKEAMSLDRLEGDFEDKIVDIERYASERERLLLGEINREIEAAQKLIDAEEELISKELMKRIAKDGDSSVEAMAGYIQDLSKNYERLADAEKNHGLLILQRLQKMIGLDRERVGLAKDLREEISTGLRDQQDAIRSMQAELLAAKGLEFEAEIAEITENKVQQLREAEEKLKALLDAAKSLPSGERATAETQARSGFDETADLIAELESTSRRNALIEEGRRSTEGLTEAQQRYNALVDHNLAQVQLGNMTQTEARLIQAQHIDALIAKTRQLMMNMHSFAVDNGIEEELIPDIEALQAALDALEVSQQRLEGGFKEGWTEGIKRFKAEANDSFGQAQQLIDGITSSIANNMVNAITAVIDGTKSFKDAFKSAAASILREIGQMILRMLILRAISSFLPGANSGGLFANTGGYINANTGGSIPGFSGGGPVPGRGPNVDSVMAMLTKGEFVMKRSAVDMYGARTLSAINAGMVPRDALAGYGTTVKHAQSGDGAGFNAGGQVPTGGGGQSELGFTPAIVLPSDQNAERLLTGGRNGVMSFLEQNATEIKEILERFG